MVPFEKESVRVTCKICAGLVPCGSCRPLVNSRVHRLDIALMLQLVHTALIKAASQQLLQAAGQEAVSWEPQQQVSSCRCGPPQAIPRASSCPLQA